MQRLLTLIYYYRAFLTFILLEVASWWMIVQNNSYQSAAFFNTSNAFVASILNVRESIVDYFELKQENQVLASENAILREMVAENYQINNMVPVLSEDTAQISQFDFIPAKVISNSTRLFNNFITINKGSTDGITPGMGVVSGSGVVGRIKATSNNFATITSLLHSKMMISSTLTSSGTFCTTVWEGRNPQKGSLQYVPRHININVGDSVVTSGYNSVYPPDIMIGTVSNIALKPNATFYEIEIDLSNDFNQLSFVYVVDNKLKQEIDSLQQDIPKIDG
ncbi:MAG: rod shape-determining protein MreC [Candidatus Cyclobacteriaceae bacterium M3_2C_046]